MNCPKCGEDLSKKRNIPTVIITLENTHVLPGGVVREENGAPVLYLQQANESNKTNTRMVAIECNYCHSQIFKELCR